MVIAQKRTEKEYRELELDSYSSLALFAKDRRQYYKRYVLGEKIREDDDENNSILIGTLVETILLEGQQELDNKFYASSIMNTPAPNPMKFINALYKRYIEFTDEGGELTKQMSDLMRMAYDDAGIKKPLFPRFIADFVGSDDEFYFKEILATRPKNLAIVTIQNMDNAQKIVNELKTNPITSFLFNTPPEGVEHFNQLQIDEYEMEGLPMKSMIDKVVVDHNKKIIYIYDLKCIWNVEEFYENYYLYRKCYIQSYVYSQAITHSLEEYKDYLIELPQFVVCDSINYLSPLIYQTDVKDLLESYLGFNYKGRHYEGVREIIENVKWAKENDEWRISRRNALTKGIVKLKKGT